MANLASSITTKKVKELTLNDEIIPADQIIAAIDSLDNRLSDVSIGYDASKEDCIETIKEIIDRFSGK